MRCCVAIRFALYSSFQPVCAFSTKSHCKNSSDHTHNINKQILYKLGLYILSKTFLNTERCLSIHLLKYSTSSHKIYSNFVTTYILLRLYIIRDYLVKNAFHSINEFLFAGHNDVDI